MLSGVVFSLFLHIGNCVSEVCGICAADKDENLSTILLTILLYNGKTKPVKIHKAINVGNSLFRLHSPETCDGTSQNDETRLSCCNCKFISISF